MEYYKIEENLYAYERELNLLLIYDDIEWDWDLTDLSFADIEHNPKTQIISEKEAMKITGAHPPYQFIMDYMGIDEMSR